MSANSRLSLSVVSTLLILGLVFFWLSSGGSGPKLHAKVFECGWLTVQKLEPFSPGNKLVGPKRLANPCFLITHPKGTLFWDAGLADSLHQQPRESGNIHLEVRRTLASQLTENSIDPSEIDFIAFSHLHFDHVGNAALFSNAHWLIQRLEYTAAFSESGRKQGLNPRYYEALKNNPRTLLEGEHDVFGDGRVKIISAPGHTVGHQVLWLDLPETGHVLLSGDLYHFKENRELRAFPSFNHNADQSLRTIKNIEKLLASTGAKLIIQHDTDDYRTLPIAPEILK